ncbi:MAG TPA: PQQ-dependent dehydrogenase, methanol/ethanol family, partial [Bryobacteraceae bacterium]|nr:PQQ-dependent dehydrogenase, methanol/ethanol family [Bryobacteraceae bacterium]
MRFTTRFLLVLLAGVCACAQSALPGATHADWPSYGGTTYSWRYSALDQINTSNVKNLAPAWIFQTGDYAENLQATPIVIDGVMYIITPHLNVFALDAATGELKWHYSYGKPQPGRPGGMTFVQNRGVAVSGGRVFFGTTDHYLVALDAKTGHEDWRVAVDDDKQCGCDITAAPLVAKDKVIVGETGGDAAHRGYLTAFDAKTGRFAWRWYVVPGPSEKGHDTWKGDSWKLGGGAPWMTGSYDPELNLVYWGTGNAGGDFNDTERLVPADKGKEANLYTASVVALDVDTGKLRWYHQEVPDDLWDFDSAYECILIDRPVNGRMRKLLVHMNKSGLTSVLDRETGEFIGAFTVPEVTTWISGITEDGKLVGRQDPHTGAVVDVCPSATGAKSWNSMAYSPRTGYIYVPVNEVCNKLTSSPQPALEGRFHANGGFSLHLPPNRTTYSHVDAWDPLTRKRVWSMPYKYILLASMLATGGNLVFTGNPEGEFFALNAKTGDKLSSYQTGAGNRGSAISYSVNGRQFIAT